MIINHPYHHHPYPLHPSPLYRCLRLSLICQEQAHGPGRPLGQASLAFAKANNPQGIVGGGGGPTYGGSSSRSYNDVSHPGPDGQINGRAGHQLTLTLASIQSNPILLCHVHTIGRETIGW